MYKSLILCLYQYLASHFIFDIFMSKLYCLVNITHLFNIGYWEYIGLGRSYYKHVLQQQHVYIHLQVC